MKLPRKAAYFIVVAADSLAERNQEIVKSTVAENLWLLATRLYSCNPNAIDGGGDYGWASLRAFCLDSLSTQGIHDLSLEATDQLLSLLGELDPVIASVADSNNAKLTVDSTDRKNEDDGLLQVNDESIKDSDTTKDVPRAAISLEDPDFKEALTTANQFAKNLRVTYNNLTAGSHLIAQQAKWATEKPIASIDVPLSTASELPPFLISLKVVWPHMNYDLIITAQKHCIERATLLRRSIPQKSAYFEMTSMYGFKEKELPIYISPHIMILPEPQLELEPIKKRATLDEATGGGLETFYNPFEKKATENGPFARVAAEEERCITVPFGNRLAIPLHVQRSQLVFDDNTEVKTTTLSFVIPPNSRAFVVKYSFQVASNAQTIEETKDFHTLQVKGVNITCLGQQIFLPIEPKKRPIPFIAEPSRLHLSRTSDEKINDVIPTNPQIECYPYQPRLRMLYSDTNAFVPDEIPLSLADGEIMTLPPIRLHNPSFQNVAAKIERLEILMIGSPNRKLYDSSTEPTPQQERDEFVEEMLYGSDPLPFKLRTLTNALTIDSINNVDDVSNDTNVMVFEIAASPTLRRRVEGCTVNIVFRYCGTGTSKNDVWRKRTITFKISSCTGPRISSIEFRPDLMMNHLSFTDEIKQKWAHTALEICSTETATDALTSTIPKELVNCGIGRHPTVSICGFKSVFILTIRNESRSDITIRRNGNDEGLLETCTYDHMSMMHELTIRPGATAKFPMIVQRIGRVDENGNPTDIVSTFARLTTLFWKSNVGQGYICIPPSSVSDILLRQSPAIVSQICTPPVNIELLLMNNTNESMTKSVTKGHPIVLTMQTALASWWPNDLLSKPNHLYMTMEFRCQRQGGFSPSSEMPKQIVPREFVWVGKLERTVPLLSLLEQQQQQQQQDDSKYTKLQQHTTKLMITVPGTYIVSGLVRIHPKRTTTATMATTKNESTTEMEQHSEEIWWSPNCHVINVS